ncbi:hypothetical protein EVAR_8128_1 [Eumeta japonica]|uniref:Uncharacterized protein n=1 Tax=Eumeta variegata TaxID=151549 RepID=A0A4C1TT31_EUMVA|nr:hypothetical protein EVAR_8128_1 [Eumeta japonica]
MVIAARGHPRARGVTSALSDFWKDVSFKTLLCIKSKDDRKGIRRSKGRGGMGKRMNVGACAAATALHIILDCRQLPKSETIKT